MLAVQSSHLRNKRRVFVHSSSDHSGHARSEYDFAQNHNTPDRLLFAVDPAMLRRHQQDKLFGTPIEFETLCIAAF
jgi:hypothetical protein